MRKIVFKILHLNPAYCRMSCKKILLASIILSFRFPRSIFVHTHGQFNFFSSLFRTFSARCWNHTTLSSRFLGASGDYMWWTLVFEFFLFLHFELVYIFGTLLTDFFDERFQNIINMKSKAKQNITEWFLVMKMKKN